LLWTVGKYWSVQGNKLVGPRGKSLTQNLEVSALEYRQECHISWLRCFKILSVLPSEFRKIFCNTPSYILLNPFETTKLGHAFRNHQARSCLSKLPSLVMPFETTKLGHAFRNHQARSCLSKPPSSVMPFETTKLGYAFRNHQARSCLSKPPSSVMFFHIFSAK